jgi:thiol-disulfide isomerase/thioredoxin
LLRRIVQVGLMLGPLLVGYRAGLAATPFTVAAQGEGAVVGTLAFQDAEDRPLLLDEPGRLYLVDLVAMGCKPCMEELPDVVRMAEEFGDGGRFQLVIVMYGWHGTALRELEHRLELGAIPLYSDSEKVGEKLGVDGWPTKLLIRDGTVLFRRLGSSKEDGRRWRRIIRRQLANGAGVR